MNKRRLLYFIGFLFILSLIFSIKQVKADNPSNMTLEYSESSEILSVTISHSSEDFNTHYIFEIIIIMDGFQIYNQSYVSQPSNEFTYFYYIEATPLELLSFEIEVRARCTQTGTITQTITIGQRAHVPKTIPGFSGFWLIIGSSMIILVVIKNKKKNN